MELYPFKSGIGAMEPIALLGHNVCVHYTTAKYYRRVVFVEPLVPFQFLDIGALAAQATSARTQCTNLENFDGELSQIRWWPLDDVQARMWLPQTNGKMVLKNQQVPIDMSITVQDPCLHMTEIFIWEDKVPWIEAVNATDYAHGAVRFRCMGFRYATEKCGDNTIQRINNGIEACVHVSASGHAGTVE